uniref:NADH dehydrogenase subunit 2 n=1 Tax=Sternochetus mangiferae TaxID=925794 RepID=UPI00223883B6|nr:NADH dehydrogenase subunit 2 [Sternochetus mangiferae]UYP50700.1 NADH dehydrogenase subunit 2 [Sternochetus mangiferae]
MLKFYKLLFFNILLISTMIVISSFSWLTTWMGLEINLMAMIPLMKQFKNKFSAEASMKYFIIQAMASMLFLFSIIIFTNTDKIHSEMSTFSSIFINSALLMKIGAAPFHFWLPEVVKGLNWEMIYIILTWQKIAPSILIFYTTKIPMFLSIIIILSSLISGVQGLNQTCLRKIMAYSSINHISWMISTILNSITLWIYYFSIYSIISLNMIMIFNYYKIYEINQLNKIFSFNKKMKFFFMLNFLSLGGLPPFLGFYPKWMTIFQLTSNYYYTLTFFLIIFTLITLFLYLRISFSSFSLSNKESLIKISNKISYYHFFINFLSLISLLICLILANLY